jgi:hypothetical protein
MGPDLPTMPEKIVFAPCGHVAEGALASIWLEEARNAYEEH